MLTHALSGQTQDLKVNNFSCICSHSKALTGHQVVLLKAVFRVVAAPGSSEAVRWLSNQFLAYVERLNIVPQVNPDSGSISSGLYTEHSTSLYALKKVTRTNNTPMGDVVLLLQLQAPANLVPRFCSAADPHLTSNNCLHFCKDF